MKFKINLILFISLFLLAGCKEKTENTIKANYLDFSKRDDQLTGGIKMIPITTPKGTFKVWTKTVGNNPTIKVLLLHGGPGLTHELYESFDGYFPNESIEYIYYVPITAISRMTTVCGQTNDLWKKWNRFEKR